MILTANTFYINLDNNNAYPHIIIYIEEKRKNQGIKWIENSTKEEDKSKFDLRKKT